MCIIDVIDSELSRRQRPQKTCRDQQAHGFRKKMETIGMHKTPYSLRLDRRAQ